MLAGVALILLSLVLSSTALSWQHQIYVDSENGVDNESCWDGGWLSPCAELNLALKGAQLYNLSTALFIQPGNYSLQNGEETQLFSMNQLAMIGNSSSPGEVVIHCQSRAPANLVFVNSTELVLNHLKFTSCGNMTAKGLSGVLYFNSCVNISMSNVTFINSSGSAILLENTAGNVSISEASFTCSSNSYECQGIFLLLDNEKLQTNYSLNRGAFLGNHVARV